MSHSLRYDDLDGALEPLSFDNPWEVLHDFLESNDTDPPTTRCFECNTPLLQMEACTCYS